MNLKEKQIVLGIGGGIAAYKCCDLVRLLVKEGAIVHCILIAPATADLIAKAAHGICDNLLTTVLCATRAPILFSPSMNVNMWANPITQENVARLKKHGHRIIEPAEGDLACGYEGKGRLPEPEALLAEVVRVLR